MNHSAGRQAALIERLFWPTLWVLTAVFLLVMIALAYALWRKRRSDEVHYEGGIAQWVGVSIAATVIILFAYFTADLVTGRSLNAISRKPGVTIELTGHQWWWQVEYVDTVPERRVVTANEIHIPVGVPVRLITNSADVIHSFWVPELHGKRDLIPGDKSEFFLRADTAGVYRGQCAEYCGLQHAMMGLLVIAEPDSVYRAWYAHQRVAAAPPDTIRTPHDSIVARGEEVFMSKPCVMCHSIRGTDAGSSQGPDLTHIASRRMIASNTVANTRGNMAGWITDPQGIKPGTLMPPNQLTPKEMDALLAFLESLK
jgi:cytochrome c oxidase subunit 2